jgi:hypothetical protein
MAHDERDERLTGAERPTGIDEPEGVIAGRDEADPGHPDHRGDFAEGTEKTHTAPGVLMGDFAAGQEDPPRAGTVQPKGDFATGQEEQPVDPTAKRGDYARGLEDKRRD